MVASAFGIKCRGRLFARNRWHAALDGRKGPSRMARATQQADRAHQMQRHARSDCMGRKVAEQRGGWRYRIAKHAACDTERRGLIARPHLRRTGISRATSIAAISAISAASRSLPHVEALSAARRQHMGGFAKQRDAGLAELRGPLDRQRNTMPPGFEPNLPRMECECFQRPPTVRRRERLQALACFAAITHTTLQDCRAGARSTQGTMRYV